MKCFIEIKNMASAKVKLLLGVAAILVGGAAYAEQYPVKLQSGYTQVYAGQEVQFRVIQPQIPGNVLYEALTVMPGNCRYLGNFGFADNVPLTVGNVACRFEYPGTYQLRGYGGIVQDVVYPNSGIRREATWFSDSRSNEEITLTVLPQLRPTITLTLPESRVVIGRPARFTAHLTGLDPAVPLAGAIMISGSGTTGLAFASGTQTLFEVDAQGNVSGEFVPGTAGTFRFTAQLYRKSDSYASVYATPVDLIVDKGGSRVNLASSVPVAHGKQEVILSGKVEGTNPTGWVQVVSGTSTVGTGYLDASGNYAVRTTLAAGAYSLIAKYGGDSNHAPSESTPLPLAADNAGASNVALRTSLKDVAAGKPTVLVASVAGSRPGGFVSFFEGANLLGRAPVIDGVAMLSVSFAASGAHEVRAEYEGDANNVASSSGALPVSVADAPPANLGTNERKYSYDKVGNLISATDKRGNSLQAAYDAMNRPVAAVNAVGGLSRTRYNGQGLPVSQTDADGRGETAEFDNFLRLIRQVDGLGNRTEYGYEIADGSSSGLPGSLQEPTEIRYPTFTKRVRFDALEQPTSETLLNPNPLGTEGLVSGRTYDARGLVKTETDANGKTSKFEYDELGRLTVREDSLGNKTQASYDARGNLLTITDPNGNVTRFEYDRNDRVVKEILPLGQTTSFTYDAAGNVESRTDASGRKLAHVYDALDRVKESRLYDAGGQLQRTTQLSWDTEDNLIGWTDTDATRPAGQQTSSGVLTYDEAHRKRSENVTVPDPAGGTYTLRYGYEYTLEGLKRRLTWPDGTAIDYDYSVHGELQSVAIPGEGSINVTDFKWLAPSKLILPGGGAKEKSYDGLLNLQTLKVKNPGQQTVLDVANSYGKLQELKTSQRTDTVGTASSNRDSSFTYDDEGRLKEAQTSGSFGNEVEVFTLDAAGNRIAHSRVSGAWSYDANNRLKTRGTGANATTYDYDDAGNLTRRMEAGGKATEYRYDGLNRLAEVRTGSGLLVARYGYDPLDRRIWKEQYRDASGNALAPAQRSYYLYADEGLIAEARQPITLAGETVTASAAPQLASQYGPEPDADFTTGHLFVKTINSNGQPVVAYFHHDHIGTPVQATDRAGNVVWAAHFNVFGQAQITTPAATTDKPTVTTVLRLPGQIEDAETGLHYNYRRYYDPATGRYITADPVGLDGGTNRYRYADADPANLTDPTGEIIPAAAAYASCVAECMLEDAAVSTLGGECNDVGGSAKSCAASCLLGPLGRAMKWASKFKKVEKAKPFKKMVEEVACPFVPGQNSFPGDTLVHVKPEQSSEWNAIAGMAQLRPINELRVGDEVLAFSEWKNKGIDSALDERLGYQKVVDVFRSFKEQKIVNIFLANGQSLATTSGHPLMTDKGWRDAASLEEGTRLWHKPLSTAVPGDEPSDAGFVKIEKISTEWRKIPVFNLEIANGHTYFVGESGELVHNGKTNCGKVQKTPSGKRKEDYTPKNKRDAKKKNAEKNDGQMKCEDCGRDLENIASKKGEPTPPNQAQVHHDPPIHEGGTRESSIPRILCPGCHGNRHRFPKG
ncbi:Ig-like domain repeat protein [Roseateles cellulosilyticus]|uniref:Ig-like domain repeat protein n=1 Tax=Pelomonas cellulosilytica TaxID=2906762 RepID=A0ABS8XY58_9BURK|nr:Ig-like domain repeat protein [Pelomonas sp. P8]MCE4554265.1 Ig-like domain repeat protein [Pelomonas sp. P8]